MKRAVFAVALHVALFVPYPPLTRAQAPPVEWALQHTSSNAIGGTVWCGGVAADQLGNVYASGHGGARTTDGYVGVLSKYDASGTLIWTATADGALINSIALSQTGDAYLGGTFWYSATFGTNSISSSYGPNEQGFVAKVDSAGNFLWAVPLLSAGGVSVSGVALDSNGNCFVTGSGYVGAGFIAKLSAAGNVSWAVGTIEGENGLAVGSGGDIFVVGWSYLAMYNQIGSLSWLNQNPGYGHGSAISLGSDGSIYTAGDAAGVMGTNAFVCKHSPSGELTWAAFPTNAGAFAMALDSSDSVYVTGYYSGSNYVWRSGPADFGGTILAGSGNACSFAAKYDTAGVLQWVCANRGAGDVNAAGAAVSSSGGNIFLTGNFTSAATFGAFTLTATNPQTFCQGSFLVNLCPAAIPQIALKVYPEAIPSVTISGIVSNRYQLEYTESLSDTNWHSWLRFVLPSSPYTVFDPAPNPVARFYRAALVQP